MKEGKNILVLIKGELDKRQGRANSKVMNAIARKLYPALPAEDEKLIKVFNYLTSTEEAKVFWLVTKWIQRKKLYQFDYMSSYEEWLYNYVNRWGACDVFCYRVLNPMVEKYPVLFHNVMKWTDSTKTYVRRAAPVCLLQSTRSFVVNCSYERVITVAEKLKDDKEIHVQKGVGWLLKYAYLTYPDEIYNYLKNNVDNLPRVIFRYALEKTPGHVKEELMNL